MPRVLTTRRSLLKAGAAAAAGALLGGRAWVPAAARAAGAGVPPELRRSSYAGLVGTSFAVVGAGVTLTLQGVDDVAGAAWNPDLAGSDDAFVLTFSGPQADGRAQGVHALRHGDLGSFELFLSPVGSPADGAYAVVVDRSVRLAEAFQAAPPAPAAADAGASAAAGTVAAGAAPAKHLRRAVIRRAGLRRAAGGLRADLVLRPGAHVRRMRVRLIRHGRTLAAAQHAVGGAEQVALTLRPARRPAAGEYDLLITTVDAHGVSTAQQSRVTLR